MSAQVTLKISKGALSGKEYCFTEKETVIIGRAKDCRIVLDDPIVSNYHCILEVHPPSVIVRDFGSKNGTYLNGEPIGQRDASMSSEEGQKQTFTSFTLKSGDCLGICKNSCDIRVTIVKPEICVQCGCEIDQLRYRNDKNLPLCADCHKKNEDLKNRTVAEVVPVKKEPVKVEPVKTGKKCEACGKPLDANAPKICDACKGDPGGKLVDNLIGQIKGDKNNEESKVAHYRKIKLLGKGGMGQVWLVEDEKSGKKMALKLMLPETAGSENGKLMFMREGYLASQLNHRNIVHVEEFGHVEGMFYIAMEYCEGGSLDGRIEKSGGKLDIDSATRITLQILDGLHYAHQAPIVVPKELLNISKNAGTVGVVHRDFKPGNIFLSDNTSKAIAKVADFGMAKAFELAGYTAKVLKTGDRGVLGTIVFMPRQQLTQCRNVKPEVDVWAAAASYYNMLTGAVPRDYRGRTFEELYLETLKKDPVPIRSRNSRIPSRLADVIDTALIEKPQIGFRSALEFKKAIENAL